MPCRSKAGISGDLSSVLEGPRKSLRPEDRRELRPDALHAQQHRRRDRRFSLFRGEQHIPLGLHSLNLRKQQLEPIKFATNLRFEMRGQGPAVAGLKRIQPLPPIATQRLVAGYALGEKQSFDAIHVLDPLGDQHFALAAEAAPIFFLWRRRFHHRAHPRFAALIRQ
jgi:hypothetical protein